MKKKEHTSPHHHVMQPLQQVDLKRKTKRKAPKYLVFVCSGENQNSQTINHAVRPWERKQLCYCFYVECHLKVLPEPEEFIYLIDLDNGLFCFWALACSTTKQYNPNNVQKGTRAMTHSKHYLSPHLSARHLPNWEPDQCSFQTGHTDQRTSRGAVMRNVTMRAVFLLLSKWMTQ